MVIAGGFAITCALAIGPPSLEPGKDAVVRPSRGEVLLDATDPVRAPEGAARKVHGEVRASVGFGFVREDAIASLGPAFEIDLSEVVPLRFGLGALFRLRMADRPPDGEGVLRRQDWDEAGDYLAILQRVEYADQFVFGDTGQFSVDLRAGQLGRVQLGHGSIVRGFHNSLDIDRRRTGVDAVTRVRGRLLDYPAELDVGAVITDLSGFQILGTRVGGRWAGAGLGFTAVGDPTAPHAIARDPGDPDAFVIGRGRRLQHDGRRGAAALGLDLSYQASDDWNYVVTPYVDLVLLPRLGHGMHIGIDGEVALGRRRGVHLGAIVELTVGSSGYDPAYFDVFYLYQRWQVPFVSVPDARPDTLGVEALPKWAFVRQNSLLGAGAYGALRFAHRDGAYAETGYQYRPGPLGHTWHLRVGVDLRPVDLAVLVAHRGQRHGFEPRGEGSVAEIDLRVPVIRYLDVEAATGWLFAIRPDASGEVTATGSTGLATGAGHLRLGVAGRIPW